MSDSLQISESISITSESNYLIVSNRKKVSELLVKASLDRHELIDVFISLHIILEVGINALFRQIITPTLKKQIDVHEMLENLDKINFIDKVTMFIYYPQFQFEDISQATKYHSIIGKLRRFSEMRNRLLHGHAISSRMERGISSHSSLKKNLNPTKLQEQIKDFKFILDGLGYYLDCLSSGLTPSGKEQYKQTYLSYDFIPMEMESGTI